MEAHALGGGPRPTLRLRPKWASLQREPGFEVPSKTSDGTGRVQGAASIAWAAAPWRRGRPGWLGTWHAVEVRATSSPRSWCALEPRPRC